MTKTETQIAEENIKNWKDSETQFPLKVLAFKFACISHNATLQRFLEEHDKIINLHLSGDCGFKMCEECKSCEGEDDCLVKVLKDIQPKITDLRQARNKYSENGI